MSKKKIFLIVILALVVIGGLAFAIPPIRERIVYRLDHWAIVVRQFLAPPEQVSFESTPVPTLDVQATLDSMAATQAAAVTATATPQDTPVPVPTPTPLPQSVNLTTVTYFSQHGYFNYCAPANLAMALSAAGWDGELTDVGPMIKPFDKDKNVMPYEMVDFAVSEGYGAVARVNGDLDTIRRFTAAGFPVLIETGVHFVDLQGVNSWMGHYRVITGYDDATQEVISQDSYVNPGTNYRISYEQFMEEWRSFNFTYIIVYDSYYQNDVLNLLGPDADETANYQRGYETASNEVLTLTGVDQFYAWFNAGSDLVKLEDYAGAAAAYDQAFSVYNQLPESLTIRPYRILWYETGPFFAYYNTGRYQDVIDLTTDNSINLVRDNVPALEESWYWRGMAKNMLGDTQGAIEDLRAALDYHPGFAPAVSALEAMGIQP